MMSSQVRFLFWVILFTLPLVGCGRNALVEAQSDQQSASEEKKAIADQPPPSLTPQALQVTQLQTA